MCLCQEFEINIFKIFHNNADACPAHASAALSVWFSVLFLFAFSWRVLGCGERSEPHLSMPSTRYGAKRVKIGQLLFCTQTNSAVEGSNFFVFVTSLS